MSDSITLTYDEICDITGKQKRRAQREELQHLKIPYTPRRDGSPLVYRSDVPDKTGKEAAREEFNPNYEALDG